MKKLLIASLLFASTVQAADIQNFGDYSQSDAKIIVGMASRHFNSDDHKYLNEVNPSIGFEAWDIQAVYVSKNSWNNPSLYLTYAPDYEVNEYLSVSLQTGIATGYTCDLTMESKSMVYHNEFCSKSGVVPMTALTFDIKPTGKDFALSISLTPEVAMLSFNYEL